MTTSKEENKKPRAKIMAYGDTGTGKTVFCIPLPMKQTNETVVIPKHKLRKPKQHTNIVEKELFLSNLRLAVEYYGKDYLRRIFKVTKGRVLRDYMNQP